MNNKLYNKKGLTFKGAFIVVVFVHIVGICSLYGYSKYKSNQLRIAREEWKNKMEQRDNSEQSEWNNSGTVSKIVARPRPKVPTEVKPNTSSSISIKKVQELTGVFLSKANTTISLALKNIDGKEKIQDQPQKIPSFSTIKKKPDLQKQKTPVIKVVNVPTKIPPVKPPAPVTVHTAPPSKKPTPVVFDYQPVPKPTANRVKTYQPKNEPRLRTYTEFDYETQETVQTFYSY
jgi:hypothetical protein